MEKVVIVGALRSANGRFMGALSTLSAVQLGVMVTTELLQQNEVEKEAVNQVIVGQVLQAGSGQNPARQIALRSGLDQTVLAYTVNDVCGSGMKAIQLGIQSIQLGESQLIVAGGIESMSQAPYLLKNARAGAKYGNLETVDTLISDGLRDAFDGELMGAGAQRLAYEYHISRQRQDEYTLASHQRAGAAQEILAQEIFAINGLGQDESVRANSTLERLGQLSPAFATAGSVTAANSSPLNDGAAFVLLASASYARAHGLTVLGEVVAVQEVGVDPRWMGLSPIPAITKVLAKAELAISDIDLFEINEAFAAQTLAVMDQLKLDVKRVNLYGGALALGHPLGASGARVVVTLLNALRQTDQHLGCASLCIGGGLGIALVIRRGA